MIRQYLCLMVRRVAVYGSKEEGIYEEAVIGGILKEDYGLGDVNTDCCTH